MLHAVALTLCRSDGAGKEIEKACQGIFPLQNTAIRKVKVLRAPKLDITKLMEVRGAACNTSPLLPEVHSLRRQVQPICHVA